MSEPSRIAMEAAVQLEIDNCIGRITTRALAERIEEVVRACAQEAPNADRFRWMENALKTIANYPVTNPKKNLDAANMQIIALAVVNPDCAEAADAGRSRGLSTEIDRDLAKKLFDGLTYAQGIRNETLEFAAVTLATTYPDNANTNAFCAALRSLKSEIAPYTTQRRSDPVDEEVRRTNRADTEC